MQADVFVSYSSKDKPIADATVAALEARKVRCWIAPRDIRLGVEYPEAIVQALGSCRLMVLIFSADANQSRQVLREVERAVHKGLTIIPLRIQDVPATGSMEFFLNLPHWLDAMTPPLEAHLTHLVNDVRSWLDARRDPAPADSQLNPAPVVDSAMKLIPGGDLGFGLRIGGVYRDTPLDAAATPWLVYGTGWVKTGWLFSPRRGWQMAEAFFKVHRLADGRGYVHVLDSANPAHEIFLENPEGPLRQSFSWDDTKSSPRSALWWFRWTLAGC